MTGVADAGLALLTLTKKGKTGTTKPPGGGTTFAQLSKQPIFDSRYVTLRGYGPDRQDQISVLCGDTPPTIKGGYAKWATVDRPLRRGVSIFQGYDPVTMELNLRFGHWDPGAGWLTDENTGQAIEQEIETLEWMAGSNFTAGQSPFVYVNTYDTQGNTTNLVPYEYQQTAGWSGAMADANLWPWVVQGGITWGKSWRTGIGSSPGAARVYQDCTLTLMNWQGINKPPTTRSKGGYFVSRPGRDTCLLIAEAPSGHALYPQALAQNIKIDHNNNPITGSRLHLSDHSLYYPIRHGLSVWVPSHTS